MSGVNLKPRWEQIRNKPADLVQESIAVDTLKFYDSELASGEDVTIQFLNGVPEIFSETIGTDSLVRASAMQAYAQPLDSDLTAIAALSTTSYGRNLLTLANQAALQAAVGSSGGDALTTNPLSQFASTTSAQLRGVISDETGSGSLVFATSPTFVTPALGAATGATLSLSSSTNPQFSVSNPGSGNGNLTVFGDTSAGVTLQAYGSMILRSYAGGFTFNGQYGNYLTIDYITGHANLTGNTGIADLTVARDVIAGRNVRIGGGTPITKVLSATATLDFGSIAANSYADLTVTVTGAAIGDTVAIGVVNGSVPADVSFFAWVSATNTITIRATNNSSTTARDPASGTFRATVTQF